MSKNRETYTRVRSFFGVYCMYLLWTPRNSIYVYIYFTYVHTYVRPHIFVFLCFCLLSFVLFFVFLVSSLKSFNAQCQRSTCICIIRTHSSITSDEPIYLVCMIWYFTSISINKKVEVVNFCLFSFAVCDLLRLLLVQYFSRFFCFFFQLWTHLCQRYCNPLSPHCGDNPLGLRPRARCVLHTKLLLLSTGKG